MFSTRYPAKYALLLLFLLRPIPAVTDCITDIGANNIPPFNALDSVFPNWTRLPTASFTIYEGDDTTYAWCTAGPITGLTIINYGTATGGATGDIVNMYMQIYCGDKNDYGLLPMTYAGLWTVGASTYPAWTWAGSKGWVVDPCNTGACTCAVSLNIYTDINACPVDGRTIQLGPGFNDILNPANPGGLTDSCGCAAPWGATPDVTIKTIRYAYKTVDKERAAPGDTVSYTIFYGRPGVSTTGITVMDSLPLYTHYVPGSSSPAPDPGYDPDPGPPNRLKWSLAGGSSAGGPTSMVTFAATLDWGNGEMFEPGSGDIAAPEGLRLDNKAHVTFAGAGCSPDSIVTPPSTVVVQRFLYWMIGDNDLVFSQAMGSPPDEIIYSIFVKNLSPTKTWWNVSIWDTVPAQVDAWNIDCGFDDPCTGWTLTPSGCAAAAPGKIVTGAKATILTWKLDMPPGMTLEVRWKATVRPAVSPGSKAINQIGLLEYGRSNIVDGTGHSSLLAGFTHVMTIALPTTYLSYVSFNGTGAEGLGFFIDFFPLNKKTQFELRGIEYMGAMPFSNVGGVSDSIGCFLGDCIGGFPGNSCAFGNAALSGGGIAGCKVERTPARYDPTFWLTNTPGAPWNFIYKITSNSPLVWQMFTHMDNCNQDRHTFAPATTLTYAGFMHYSWIGDLYAGDSLVIINTGLDVYGNYLPTLTTTVHMFRFNYTTLAWDYMRTYNIGPEGAVTDYATSAVDVAPWRMISSDATMVVNVGAQSLNNGVCCCCSGGDNHGTFCPTRETGYTVSTPGNQATFYGLANPPGCSNVSILNLGNVGAVNATYQIWKYTPDSSLGPAAVPPLLRGTSGLWTKAADDWVPFGLAAANNPMIYTRNSTVDRGGGSLFRVKLLSGGPIQMLCGMDTLSAWAGGSVIHAVDGAPMGTEFWLNQVKGRKPNGPACPDNIFSVTIFAPKRGMVLTSRSQDGAYAIYTTNGPDQAVAFLRLTDIDTSRNWKYTAAGGKAIALYSDCKFTEKGYTAPFLETGVHYTIVVPPVVYSGQAFWITVIVQETGGMTKDDYCGTTSFTATDPTAKIEGSGMDAYNYLWDSNDAAATCKAAGCIGSCDNGVKVFIQVVFTKLGMQTIVASDTTDGSITGLASVMVVGVDVKLTKEQRFTIAASGDTVQFKICWSNYSSASAFTFVITDAVPVGTTYVPEVPSAMSCGSTDGVSLAVAYSTSTTSPPTGTYTTASGMLPTGVRWLRWTAPLVGVQTTGCACFRLSVD